jgi:hypothetical protein
MLLLNGFWAYSDSWHVAVNSDIKHTVYGMGVHDMAARDVGVHEVGVHDMGVHDVAVHDAAVHDVGLPGVGIHKTVNISVVKN